MPKKSKKFIDKKNSVTFHLVHRSQQDPLAADEKAPQHVLLPIKEKAKSSDHKKRIDEQQKFGIFFDDEYNYLQHLRDVNNTIEWIQAEQKTEKPVESKLKLPSSVFASEVEEDVGLLNKAAPQSGLRLDLDPDVVAAMDDDFDFDDPDNELEDNFMELADAECSDEDDQSDINSDFQDSEDMDEVGSLDGPQYTFKDEETKSRFTEYSMSSSVIKRNEQLTLLDDRFEQMFTGYDENEIGALDCEEIEGDVPETSEILLKFAEEFEKDRRKEQLDKDILAARVNQQNDNSDAEEELMPIELKEKEKWDCESILSTYSNIYNHPKLIVELKQPRIKINMRTGMPIDALNSNKLTAKALSRLNEQNDTLTSNVGKSVGGQSIISNLSVLSIRPKDETPEQRKERKQNLREYRRERRIEKKVNTIAFKEESKRQTKIGINNKMNVQGNRLL